MDKKLFKELAQHYTDEYLDEQIQYLSGVVAETKQKLFVLYAEKADRRKKELFKEKRQKDEKNE